MYIFVSFLGCFVVVTVVVAVVVGSSGFYRVSECEPKRCRFDSIEIEKSLVNVWYFRIIFFLLWFIGNEMVRLISPPIRITAAESGCLRSGWVRVWAEPERFFFWVILG